MKRLLRLSAGKAMRLGRVLALATCLLAVCISGVVATRGKKVFAGYNDQYDLCVSEAIEATPNTDNLSHIFFRAAVQETFNSKDLMVNYLENLLENIQDRERLPDPELIPEVDKICYKYLEILLTNTITDLTGKDFCEVVGQKWKDLKAEHREFYKVYLNPDDIPGCLSTDPNSHDIFRHIVTKSLRPPMSMGKFVEELQRNRQVADVPDEKTRRDVDTLTDNYVDHLEDMAKYDIVLDAFREICDGSNGEPVGESHRLQDQDVATEGKMVFAGYNDYYDLCVNEAIEATPNMDKWSHIFFRAAVQETFSRNDLMDTYIENLLENIQDRESIPECRRYLSPEVNEIGYKYFEILFTKIITDVTGKDFSEIVAEKWKNSAAKQGNFYDVYLRPDEIPGCLLTNTNSQDIFKHIVTKSLRPPMSMSKFVEELRRNSQEEDVPDEQIRRDVDTLTENYINHFEDMAKYDFALTEFMNIFRNNKDDNESTGSSSPPSKRQCI